MGQAVQLGHDEFLLLLGLLRLPFPLALGEDPTEGYTEQTLNVALTSAMSSLLARKLLLQPPDDDASLVLAPVVEKFVKASALADRCLMLAARHDDMGYAVHYLLHNDTIIAQTNPHERVHRMEWLDGSDAIVEHILSSMVPYPLNDTPLSLTIDADTFASAIDARVAGQVESAMAILANAGVSDLVAKALIESLDGGAVRYAVMAVRHLQRSQPQGESVLVVQGIGATWYAEDLADQPGKIHVSSIAADQLKARLQALVQQMMSGVGV